MTLPLTGIGLLMTMKVVVLPAPFGPIKRMDRAG